MAKAPALSTQILALQQELEWAKAEITDLQSKLTSANSSRDSYSKSWTDARADMENAQSILDAFPGISPRHLEGEYRDIPVATRLARWVISTFIKTGITHNV
jgi:hypothetical protein